MSPRYLYFRWTHPSIDTGLKPCLAQERQKGAPRFGAEWPGGVLRSHLRMQSSALVDPEPTEKERQPREHTELWLGESGNRRKYSLRNQDIRDSTLLFRVLRTQNGDKAPADTSKYGISVEMEGRVGRQVRQQNKDIKFSSSQAGRAIYEPEPTGNSTAV